jgi:hypothetical protein
MLTETRHYFDVSKKSNVIKIYTVHRNRTLICVLVMFG